MRLKPVGSKYPVTPSQSITLSDEGGLLAGFFADFGHQA
jgi:hypothetical protein